MKIAEAMRMFFSGWSWFVKPLWSKVGGRMWTAIVFLESCNVWDGLETIPTSKHMIFSGEGFQAASSLMVTGFQSSPFIHIHPLVTWGVLRNFRLIIRSVSWLLVSQLGFPVSCQADKKHEETKQETNDCWKKTPRFFEIQWWQMTVITDSKMHFPRFDCLFSAGLAGIHHDVVHLCLLRPNGWFRGPQWRDPKWCHSSGQAASIAIIFHPISWDLPNSPRRPGVTSRIAWSPSSPWPHWATGRSKCGTWPSIHRWRPWCRSSPSSSWPSAA